MLREEEVHLFENVNDNKNQQFTCGWYSLHLCLSLTLITSALKGSLHLKTSYSLMYKLSFNTTLKLHEAISLIYNINK